MSDRFDGIRIIKLAATMKRNMEKRNLLRAKAKCPYCNGYWHAVLAGRNKHIHLYCDGCKVRLMT